MALQIKEGIEYVTEAGERTGVLRPGESGAAYDTGEPVLCGHTGEKVRLWRLDGRHLFKEKGVDIVSEWSAPTESPIRTVTRRTIEDGSSGYISWKEHRDGSILISVRLPEAFGQFVRVTKSDLTNVGLIISQLAEFLDEDKGDE